MFRSAATKIAHNSTLPSLGGKKDLKLLQDVITSEKAVLYSLSKLSNDLAKSSEAMKNWGAGEGEDLGDVLSACTTLMDHYTTSVAAFSNHIAHVRECLKQVRSREENLDEMHRRRKTILAKADAAEKKLAKMNPDHKYFRQQTELLLGLRDQIRTSDVEIMNEEASIGDFKRIKAREWMGVFLGGLSESSEKGAVIASFSRSIVSHIPLDQTQPGLARAPYSGHAQVEPLLVEAEHQLHKIIFSGDISQHTGLQRAEDYSILQQYGSTKPDLPSPPGATDPPARGDMQEFGAYAPEPRASHTYTPGYNPRSPVRESALSEETTTSSSPWGGQFSTLPTNQGSRTTDPSGPGVTSSSLAVRNVGPTNGRPDQIAREPSFSSSVATALDSRWNTNRSTPNSPTQGMYRTRPDFPPSYIPSTNPPPGAAPAIIPGISGNGMPMPLSHNYQVPRDDDHPNLAYLSRDSSEMIDGRRKSHEDRQVRFGGVEDIYSPNGEQVPMTSSQNDAEIRPPPHDMTQRPGPWIDPRQPIVDPNQPISMHRPTPVENMSSPPDRPGPWIDPRQPINVRPPQTENNPNLHDMPPRSDLSTATLQSRPSADTSHSSYDMQQRFDSPQSRPPPAEIRSSYDARRSVRTPPSQPSVVSREQMPPSEREEHVEEAKANMNEGRLNIIAAREIGQQMDGMGPPSPLAPPSLPFSGRKSVSPHPYAMATVPDTAPARERDNSSFVTPGKLLPQIHQPQPIRGGVSLSDTLSTNPSEPNNPSSPLAGPQTPIDSEYLAPSTPITTSQTNSSFTPSSTKNAPKTISVAAFRRPNPNVRTRSTTDIGELESVETADCSPLNVRKKSLTEPSNSGPGQAYNNGGMQRVASTPTDRNKPSMTDNQSEGRSRAASTSGLANDDFLNEDFSYISAYVNEHDPPIGGYGSGKFATNLENEKPYRK